MAMENCNLLDKINESGLTWENLLNKTCDHRKEINNLYQFLFIKPKEKSNFVGDIFNFLKMKMSPTKKLYSIIKTVDQKLTEEQNLAEKNRLSKIYLDLLNIYKDLCNPNQLKHNRENMGGIVIKNWIIEINTT
jgi:hypothetical protein